MSIYRFPPITNTDGIEAKHQLQKIKSELHEAIAAEMNYRCGVTDGNRRKEYGMELLDVIHATETALRMEFTEDEAQRLRAKVIEKNAKRGYYEVRK